MVNSRLYTLYNKVSFTSAAVARQQQEALGSAPLSSVCSSQRETMRHKLSVETGWTAEDVSRTHCLFHIEDRVGSNAAAVRVVPRTLIRSLLLPLWGWEGVP